MSNRGPAVGPWPDWRLMQHARTRLVGEAEPLPLCQKATVWVRYVRSYTDHANPKTVLFILYVRLKIIE